jgi:glycosyltransferase involved in cell wall biosynthesis
LNRKKIAIILSRFPYPLDKGDKLRAFNQIKYISKFHDIFLFALNEASVSKIDYDMVAPYCKEIKVYKLRKLEIVIQSFLSLFKSIPVQVGYFYSPSIHRKMTNTIKQINPDTVYCQLSRTALYGKDLPFNKVIDFQDAFSMNYDRMQRNMSGIQQLFYKRESLRMKQFETSMLQWFDTTTIISEHDKSNLASQPNTTIVISNGVDLDYFQPQSITKTVDLLFLGNLSYQPNRAAVDFLIQHIMPALIKIRPTIKLNIAGAAMAEELKKYESSNIHLSGWHDDIRVAYASATLFVAPLFTGAGLQNKLLEAMSMKLPSITTSIVNASLHATENKEVIIANTTEEFVSKIIQLLDNPEQQIQLASQAYEFVSKKYGWDQSNQQLVDLL